jgi:16S rRNA (uracil1498-N3)-methyltransferase
MMTKLRSNQLIFILSLPYFHIPFFDKDKPDLYLDEDNSRHIVQVLRKGVGEELHLTDGRGTL